MRRFSDGGSLEETRKVHSQIGLGRDGGAEFRQSEGVATQRKEIVVDADMLQAKYVCPTVREDLLQFGPRRYECLTSERRISQPELRG